MLGVVPHYEPKNSSPVSMVSKFLDFVQMSYSWRVSSL
jgi:hypothetical protein